VRVATRTQPRTWVWVPVVAGIGVAVALGVYGRIHQASPVLSDVGAFLRWQTIKSWLATGVFLLAVLQVLSALALYGRLPRVPAGPWLATVHRWSGRLALLLSLPVSIHCLYALGIHAADPRVEIHSFCGCVFYGAFVAKMLLVSRPEDRRGWAIPVAGGLAFAAITGLWLTSALWFFGTVGVT
jgi:Family of unknown function (DUF6529)